MKLLKIIIENYRSIEGRVEIDFTKINDPCYFLFGINEAGKSNILKACRLFNFEYLQEYDWLKDCSKSNKKCGIPTQVCYHFSFTVDELDIVKTKLTGKVPQKLIDSIYGVEYWISGKKDHNGSGYVITIKDSSAAYRRNTRGMHIDGMTIAIESEILDSDKDSYFKFESADELGEILAFVIGHDFFENIKPNVTYWNSSSTMLISESIDLTSFAQKPKSCLPLFNIFKLLKDPRELSILINESLAEKSEYLSLEKKLSNVATAHLNSIWKEHKVKVDIHIESTGQCSVHFSDSDSDNNLLEIQDRSDGFQRFISFILTFSAENINQELSNSIILLDEPEIHLHPSGIEYLRDELLKFSRKNNTILAASHSIFLVDKTYLQRHVIVKKDAGKTSIEYTDPNNPFREEIIYRALNTSIYEIIQPYNIIFEGKIDSTIFHAIKRKFPTEFSGLIDVGGIGATGSSEVEKYGKFFKGNSMAKAIAIYDSDETGKNAKLRCKQNPDNGFLDDGIFELSDIYNDLGKSIFELEDLLPDVIVLEAASSQYKHQFSLENINQTKPILEEIKRLKIEQHIKNDKNLEELKDSILKLVLQDAGDIRVSDNDFKTKYEQYLKFLYSLQDRIRLL